MDYVFGKPAEFRLEKLKNDPVRIPTETVRGEYERKFGGVSYFFDRLLAREYEAAFRHYYNDDIAYSFRNEDEIAFAGHFPRSNRPDLMVLGISAYGESARYDTKSLATPHKPLSQLIHHMSGGLLFAGSPNLPEIELYARDLNDISSLERRLEPLLLRFDGLLYSTKLPEKPGFSLDRLCSK